MADKLSPITLAAAKKSSGGGDTKQILEEIEQTPVEAGGETLSTIDDKLNYILEGVVGINLDNYDITIVKRRHESANPVQYTTSNKIALVFACSGNGASCSVGNKDHVENYSRTELSLDIADDYNYTVAIAAYGSAVGIITITEKS